MKSFLLFQCAFNCPPKKHSVKLGTKWCKWDNKLSLTQLYRREKFIVYVQFSFWACLVNFALLKAYFLPGFLYLSSDCCEYFQFTGGTQRGLLLIMVIHTAGSENCQLDLNGKETTGLGCPCFTMLETWHLASV